MDIATTFNEFSQGQNLDTNPFQQEDGTLYLRYDGLIIQNSVDGDGVQIGFVWRGEPRVWLPLPRVRIADNNAINLNGIEGRQKIGVESANDIDFIEPA